MPAPKGNKYAVGNQGGRPTKYDEKYCQEIIDYFSIEPNRWEIVATSKGFNKSGDETFCKEEKKLVPNELPTLNKFSARIGVYEGTLLSWAREHEEFCRALEEAKRKYKEFLIANGVAGLFNAAFTIFVAKNTTDMRDKQELDIKANLSLGQLFETAENSQKGIPPQI